MLKCGECRLLTLERRRRFFGVQTFPRCTLDGKRCGLGDDCHQHPTLLRSEARKLLDTANEIEVRDGARKGGDE